MKREYTGNIMYQEQLLEDCYRMVLKTDADLLQQALPGQFVHLRINPLGGPLLRRPFSIHSIDQEQGTLSLLYAVVGQGTRIMAADLPGKTVTLLGPLGTGFPHLPASTGEVVLVGGGLGTAPLLHTASWLQAAGRKTRVILGFPSQDRAMLASDFTQIGATVHITTEDGSEGYHGYPTSLLHKVLLRESVQAVFACGPHAMLENVAKVCGEAGIDAWISMEEKMACGIGACLGCVVRIRDEMGSHYEKACLDGPVFKASEVIFDET
ncbi:dihydroorotate dehydrogenase electron transfer subunit [Anoxynatronum buryatiense]|uniref:Dihydroorotate dehydrogenase B (NAD(+)), electron transfer subunit n=1 Tax=Anoxynatronum buryatiense TaxID=489973 RepID=A0AA45WTX7_9CLOT|nr:dihydroorotate dehydrogenase electron transfer subunit [Anoxynatronum buryatiense]SMP44486.1 dihydroorotate dehydrogenase electron transfer subunit [Anoxynatronum buryatiense]